MTERRAFYHVTNSSNVEAILEQGLLPGWGDDGFGIYVFDDLAAAEDYAADQGWDGALAEPVILALEAYPCEVWEVVPDPHWPNPEDYEHVLRYPADPDAAIDQQYWKPGIRVIPIEPEESLRP